MTFVELQTQAKYMLNDSNIFILTAELKTVLNEAQRIACLLSFCYEKHKATADWGGTIAAYQNTFPLPTDCIVPIFVYDSDNEQRIYPAKLSQFELLGSDWESGTGDNYQNYCLFDPTYNTNSFMLVYPKVNTTSMQINMLYAASPPTLVNNADVLSVPLGYDKCLLQYMMFYGWTKRKGKKALEEALEQLILFFSTITRLNDLMRSRYPQGRDHEPVPTEQVLERFLIGYQQEQQQRAQ